MRLSKLFGKTLREEPSEAELASHKLMLRAGMIHQVGSGIYGYLPLAWRSLRKIEQIIREEMDAAGGQEMRLSVLQPRELWDATGRTEAFGDDLFTLQDRRDRTLVVAPTHEEELATMVRSNAASYRDLPKLLYQIHTKFRDEPRPRGGLIRVREFDMKDAYSFDVDEEGLARSYDRMVEAYKAIYRRAGMDVVQAEADSGAIGGKDSHEFILLAEAGEDTIMLCEGCGYAANTERAVFRKFPNADEEMAELKEVHTPGARTIEEVTGFLSLPQVKTIKAVFYSCSGEVLVVVIRGDLEVNEVKLGKAVGKADLRLATPEEVKDAGLVSGSASPVGLKGCKVIADDSIELGRNFVAGANKHDHHLLNVNFPRDFAVDVVADISLAREGYECLMCQGRPMVQRRGIEVGHVFKLGTQYGEALNALFSTEEGGQLPVTMGCYGIGLGRLLAAAIEQHHDERGIIFPASIAPYQVHLTALNSNRSEVAEAADDLEERLESAGVEVLHDDRSESAGVKLTDADLIGLPVRVVVSPRNIKQGVVEIKSRDQEHSVTVPDAEAVDRVKTMLLEKGV